MRSISSDSAHGGKVGLTWMLSTCCMVFGMEPVAAREPGLETEEVVVTARRRDERLQDVPVAVTAVSRESLERYAVTDLVSVTQLVPSMVVGRQVTGSSASIFLRGVGSTSLSSGFDQSVSLNLDGLAMSRGREIVSSQYDLQQVEVLKGPQALFFGRNSTGGVISITTAVPTDEFEASAKVGYETEAEELYGEAVISGPLSPSWSARLAARASTMDGFFDNPAQTNVTQGFVREPSSDRRPESQDISARLTTRYAPEDSDLQLTFRLAGTQFEDSGAGDIYERLCAGGATTPRRTYGVVDPYADCSINGRNSAANVPPAIAATMPYARDGETYTDHESYIASITAEYDFSRVSLTSVTGAYGFTQNDLNNFNGATAGVYVTQYASYDQISQELRAITRFDGPVNAMVGVYFADSEFEFNTAALIAPLPVDPVTGRYDSFHRDNGFDAQTISAFTEVTWDITPTIELAGGARWTGEDKDSFAVNVYAHPNLLALFPLRGFEDEFSDDNVSPQATLTWRPTTDLTLYAAYKEGFKSGGYNTSISIGPTTTLADGQFESETAQGYELGIKSVLLAGALRLNATVYDYDYDDLQVQIFDAATIAQRVANAGTLTTRGFEGEFNWRVPAIDRFELHGAVSYNEAKFSGYVGACYAGQTVAEGCNLDPGPTGAFNSQDFEDRTAPKAPEWSGRLGGSYELALGTLIATFTADAAYTGEYNFTDSLRPDAIQDEFTRIDASIRLARQGGTWEVALIGRNLSDELVVTSANDMPAQGAGGTGTNVGIRSDMNAIVERPRQFYLQFSTRF